MPKRYQDVYPSAAILDSALAARPSAAELLTLEYFEAEPAAMPRAAFVQHHVLLNLNPIPQHVENWRAGAHRDFTLNEHDVVITPAGLESGWRWHARSRVIIVTLEPEKLSRFALSELGAVLTAAQLQDVPQAHDPELCFAGDQMRQALDAGRLGADVMFESLARVFLIKLIERYGARADHGASFTEGVSAERFKRVFDHVDASYAGAITLDALARIAGVSTYHFSRQFRAAVGLTPMQFVARIRVEKAKRRLLGDAALSAIAHECGFSDQAHFARVFKQATGLAPGAWRTANR